MAKKNVNVNEVIGKANQVIAETDTAVKALTTQADQVSILSKMTGFGKRINVPPDEVHYVVAGRSRLDHIHRLSAFHVGWSG